MALHETEVKLAHVIGGPSLLDIMFSHYDAPPPGERERTVEFSVNLMLPGMSMEARLETAIFGGSRYRTSDTRGEWYWILRGKVMGVTLLGKGTSYHDRETCSSIQHQEFLLRYRLAERQGMLYVLPRNPVQQSLLREILPGKQVNLEDWGHVIVL